MADAASHVVACAPDSRSTWEPLEIVAAMTDGRTPSPLSAMTPGGRPPREDALVAFMRRRAADYSGPVLLFDLVRIEQMLRALALIERRHRCRFLASVKSAPFPELLERAARHLSGFDVSNLEEYRRLPANLAGKLIALTSPVLRPATIRRFLDRGNHLVIYADSRHQLSQLAGTADDVAWGVRLDSAALLRRQRDRVDPGCGVSRFGFPVEELLALRPQLRSMSHRFAGALVHHAGERNDASTYLALVEGSVAVLDALGLGGHGINVGGGEHRLDLDALDALARDIRERLGDGIALAFEPGRLLTRGSGYAVGRIENWKRRGDGIDYVLDLSMDCHLRWSAPTLIVPRPQEPGAPVRVRFHGPTCHERDCLGQYVVWSARGQRVPFRPGELVLFGNVTGYSVGMQSSFNGVATPRLEFLRDGS